MDRQRKWDQLARLLSDACEQERPRLKPEDAAQIEEFIEHDEYGLAHEWLTNALKMQGAAPTPLTNSHLSKASDLMKG